MGNTCDTMGIDKVQDEIITIKYELHSVKRMFWKKLWKWNSFIHCLNDLIIGDRVSLLSVLVISIHATYQFDIQHNKVKLLKLIESDLACKYTITWDAS